ncbi:MAG: hypothetical protein ACK571_19430, partial [Pseudanabaena sp.]
ISLEKPIKALLCNAFIGFSRFKLSAKRCKLANPFSKLVLNYPELALSIGLTHWIDVVQASPAPHLSNA